MKHAFLKVPFWHCGILAVVLLAGCSGGSDSWSEKLPETVSATGIVLLDGAPLEGASVVVSPVAPGKHSASAVTDSGGKFDLKAFPSKTGAVPGPYLVTVQKTVSAGNAKPVDPKTLGEDAAHDAASPLVEAWKSLLPEIYDSPETSGLSLVIQPEGTSALKLELKSKP